MMCKFVNFFIHFDFRVILLVDDQKPLRISVSNIIPVGLRVLTIDYATSYYQWLLLSNRHIPSISTDDVLGMESEVRRRTFTSDRYKIRFLSGNEPTCTLRPTPSLR